MQGFMDSTTSSFNSDGEPSHTDMSSTARAEDTDSGSERATQPLPDNSISPMSGGTMERVVVTQGAVVTSFPDKDGHRGSSFHAAYIVTTIAAALLSVAVVGIMLRWRHRTWTSVTINAGRELPPIALRGIYTDGGAEPQMMGMEWDESEDFAFGES